VTSHRARISPVKGEVRVFKADQPGGVPGFGSFVNRERSIR
jgi:hypothetical protein